MISIPGWEAARATSISTTPTSSTRTLLYIILYTIYNYKIIIIGGQGYFYLDYPYLLDPDLASDMWTITKAT